MPSPLSEKQIYSLPAQSVLQIFFFLSSSLSSSDLFHDSAAAVIHNVLQAHIVGSGVSREHERDHDAEHQRNDGSRHSRTTHGGVDPVLEGRQHQDQHAQQSAGADAGQTALPVDTLPEAAQQHCDCDAGQEAPTMVEM